MEHEKQLRTKEWYARQKRLHAEATARVEAKLGPKKIYYWMPKGGKA